MTFPGFQSLTVRPDLTYQGLLIQSTQQAVEIGEAIQQAKIAGTIDDGRTDMTTYPNGQPGWIVQLTIGGVMYTGYQFDWLVLDSQGNLRVWHGTSQWPGINPQLADKFTLNTPMIWDGEAPSVSITGGVATIAFPQPVSANAPFVYTVIQTDTTTQTATESTPTPEVSGDTVTLTVDGLAEGHSYTFAVSVTTNYPGVTATSPPSTPVTA